MKVFTNNYPGANRITIKGTPNSDYVVLKYFGNGSRVIDNPTTKVFRGFCGKSSTYPLKKLIVNRGDLSKQEFIDLVEYKCVELSNATKALVVDDCKIWGFYEKQQEPFNDPIPF